MAGSSEGVAGRPLPFVPLSALYALVAGASYFVAAEFLTVDGVAVWYPPAALSLAYLVAVGLRGAPVVLATRVLASVVLLGAPFSFDHALAVAVLVTASTAAAATWLRRRIPIARTHLGRVGIVVAGCLGAAVLTGMAAVGYLVAAGEVAADRLTPTVVSFWLGDAAATLCLAPVLLLRPGRPRSAAGGAGRAPWLGSVEPVAQVVAGVAAAWLAVVPEISHPQFYPTFVPLIWVAMRRSLAGACVAVAATGTLVPLLALDTDRAGPGLNHVQLFLLVYAVTGLLQGAVEADRRAARAALLASEQQVRREHASLVLAEERFRQSFEAAPIGIALVAPDGRFLRVNRALCEMLGYPADQLLAATFQDVTHPDDLDADLALVAQVLDGALPGYSMEKRYHHRDGRVVTVQLDVSLVRDDDGAPLHFIAQIQDVSERRAMLESLVSAHATQQACLEALEQGVALSTMAGECKLLNPAGQRLLGHTAASLTEMVQRGEWRSYTEEGELLDPRDRPIAHTMATGEPVTERILAWRRADGELISIRVGTQPVHDDAGKLTGVVTAFADITAQRAAERARQEALAQLEWQAFHDPLTGLPNRTFLLDQLQASLERTRDTGERTAVFYLDLDHFKLVNDTMGHEAGDQLLQQVGNRLRGAVRAYDTVARFGGDEFVIVADGVESAADARRLARRVVAALGAPLVLGEETIEASASIGIALAHQHTADELLRDADAALYRAKQAGRGRFELLDAASPTRVNA